MKKNRIMYFSFLILTWIFVYFYGGRVPYMLFQTVLIIPAVLFVHVIVSWNILKYSQKISVRAPMKGDKVEYCEIIANESMLPCCYIEIIYFNSKHLTGFNNTNKKYWLGPLQRIEQSQNIQFAHRGIYEFGACEIIFTDLLGLFQIRRSLDEYIKTRVLPKVYTVEVSELYNDRNLEAQNRSKKHFEDVSLFEDVRQYHYGDSMKRIHWKLSAKHRELLVKNYSGISRNSVTVLIDMQPLEGEPEDILLKEDNIIESALSVVKSFSDRYEKVQAVFFDGLGLKNVQISNPQEFLYFYDIIGLMDFKSQYSASELIKFAVMNDLSSGNVLLVSASLDLDFLGELLEICLKGFDTSVVLCDTVKSGTAEEKQLEEIKSHGVLVVDSSVLLSSEGGLMYG